VILGADHFTYWEFAPGSIATNPSVNRARTLAAIDRLVHHARILEMNVESRRRKAGQAQA
jgi:hypothetical protein